MANLSVRGARQHNLRGVSCEIPRDALVVITGPSGSGKSSLAFDTIYAEGQRRYVESLSAYARQFLEQLAKPDVEAIDGLSPAIAIEQRALAKSPRSTVGTVTEIADYLRLLFARVGTPHCPSCGKPIAAQTVQQIVDTILALGDGARATLLAPIVRSRKGELRLELERLRREGFVRVRIDGAIVDLGDEIVLDGKRAHDLDVVVDRVVIKEGVKGRVTDSVELALKLGDGRILVDPGEEEPFFLSERFACVDCGLSLPPIEPRMFSFNGPHGACPRCDGIGTRTRIDPELVVPDPRRTLREGAVLPWGRRGSVALALEVDRAVRMLGVDPDVAWRDLPTNATEAILHGPGTTGPASQQPGSKRRRASDHAVYEGIVPRLERAVQAGELTQAGDDEEGQDDGDDTNELSRYVVTRACDGCGGKRLRPEALAVRLGGENIADLGQMPLRKLAAHLERLRDSGELAPRARVIADPLLRAVVARLGFLVDVGLDYLQLDRSAMTLSGGEGQRIRLATQIGSALVGVLYVLDEPSVGLHARDNARLVEALRRLVTLGNSVLVVEHDRDTIAAADHVIDMGPGAGTHGGRIVAQGSPTEIQQHPESVTGPYLSGQRSVYVPSSRKRPNAALEVVIRNATEHNLKGVDVAFPVGLLTSVTGVSGSGKSSLVSDTLLPAARRKLYRAAAPVGACDGVEGLDHFDKVVSIDQAPIGRTPRSNPATYTGVFALLRELFSGLPEARARGYKPGRFSFNVKGGRCEACQGDGVLRVEMHFLPDVFVECETCAGRRYNRETLEVKYRGMSIADLLDRTVDEAMRELDAIPRVREQLAALARVGLGYIKLGQPATTLSGGEAQRIKLARELARKATGSTLYILDEPTTGLHFSDIELLLVALKGLRDAGNTVVVIEHNLEVIASSDWVIELGPDGGERGGELVAAGPPEVVAEHPRAPTGSFLKDVLRRDESHPRLSGADRAAVSDVKQPAKPRAKGGSRGRASR
ncbi:MAG: excinuclease ABC subunit UvrA [Polyangiaceae bacterium]